jgi:hypothetical protein
LRGSGRAFVLGPGGAHALLVAALAPLNGHGGDGAAVSTPVAPRAM